MKGYTYIDDGKFDFTDKAKPELQSPKDAVVRVTLSSICTSDLHIKHGSVPRACKGITVGHEMFGVVEATGSDVMKVKPGDRVAVNVETFCGECFYCKRGWVNNCEKGGWELGCRIDGAQAEYVRVPYADNGLTRIPDEVSDEQALFVGDILATGYWAAKIAEISEDDIVLVIGGGPTGLCTLWCVELYKPGRIVVCEIDESRRKFVKANFPDVIVVGPEEARMVLDKLTDSRGADRVIEVAGTDKTFEMAWKCARPNAVITVVALYDKPQTLPLPRMYGKNLTFKFGGVDANDCDEIMRLIAEGRIDTTKLITHRLPLSKIAEGYRIFEGKKDGVIKVAIFPD